MAPDKQTMSSQNAEYTTKRNDHANWRQPSRRRGTYFGTYAAPKQPFSSTEPLSSQPDTTTNTDTSRDGPPSNQQLARSGNNQQQPRPANTHARTRQFLKRVSRKKINGRFSSEEIALFRRKNAELEEQLDTLRKNFDDLSREHYITAGENQICQGKIEELTKSMKSLEEENKRVNGLLILERARTRNAIEKTEAVEKKFQTEFEAYKSATGETIKSLEASLDDVQTQLQTAQRQLRDMFALKEENQRRKEECARMKQSLKRVCL